VQIGAVSRSLCSFGKLPLPSKNISATEFSSPDASGHCRALPPAILLQEVLRFLVNQHLFYESTATDALSIDRILITCNIGTWLMENDAIKFAVEIFTIHHWQNF
jgi:hypothetical protein